MIVPKHYIKTCVKESYSEQYETDPIFHMAIDQILYTVGNYVDYSDFIGIISELCKFKYDETQFSVNMRFVQDLLSGYLKDYDKNIIL